MEAYLLLVSKCVPSKNDTSLCPLASGEEKRCLWNPTAFPGVRVGNANPGDIALMFSFLDACSFFRICRGGYQPPIFLLTNSDTAYILIIVE